MPARCAEKIRAALASRWASKRRPDRPLGARVPPQAHAGARNRPTIGEDAAVYQQARALLEDCLRHDPAHAEALWLLAAVRSVLE